MPKTLIFPNKTPAAITNAYNATMCAMESGLVNKSCSQFIILFFKRHKCRQLKRIGQTLNLKKYSLFGAMCNKFVYLPRTGSNLRAN